MTPEEGYQEALRRIEQARRTGYQKAIHRIAEAQKTGTTVLDLSSLWLTSLPMELSDCSSLRQLDLSMNQIVEVDNLPEKLQSLDLRNNQIPEIKDLPQTLQTLFLGDNRISQVKNLPNGLQTLDLSLNQIVELKSLPNGLMSISAIGNKISRLENLPNSLQELYLSSNQISEIKNLPDGLHKLCLYRNPICNFPTELLGEGEFDNCLDNVKAWFADLGKESIPNRTIKFMVSGNSNVGKSSLLEALRFGKAPPGQESTHGIRIEPLPLTDGIQQIDGISFDFGGQEIYHGTHQLFLRSRAVQVVVFDAQTEVVHTSPDRRGKQGEVNRNKPLPQWLDELRRRSPDSQFVLVQNKIDGPTPLPPGTKALVDEVENGQECAVARASAYTGRGIPALKGYLIEAAQNLPEYGMLMPASWVAVRNYFLENSQKPVTDRQRIVSREFFTQLCTERNVLPNSEAALRRYLHNTGVIYHDETYLQETIIADQQWVIEAIYEVLDRRGQLYDELTIGYGKKQLKYLFRYFNQDYTPDERRLFVAMMESCGLCFPLREEPYGPVNDDTYYVFPNFLPNEQPDSVRYFLVNPAGKIVYRQTVPFLAYAHIQKLIASWGAKTRQENLWRSGFLVTLPQEGGFVLEADFMANTLTLTAEPTVSADSMAGLLRELSCENAGWQAIDSAPSLVTETQVASPSMPSIRETLPDVVQTKIRKLVVSYAKEDVRYVDLLRKKMAARKTIELWYDRHIDGWSDWDSQIRQQFTDCDGYVIFLSDTYMDAETKTYIHEKEIPLMLQRFKAGQAYVSVIQVTPYDTQDTELKSFLKYEKAALMPNPEQKLAEASQFLESFISEKLFGDFLQPKTN